MIYQTQILGKALRVDHVSSYKPPKDNDKLDDETRMLHSEGCAPKLQLQLDQIKREQKQDESVGGVRLPMRLPIGDIKREGEDKNKEKKHKNNKMKKEKKSKKTKKNRKRKKSSSSDSSSSPELIRRRNKSSN